MPEVRIEDQNVARLTHDHDVVRMARARLGEMSWDGCCPSVRSRYDPGRPVLGGELVQHPDQRQRIDVVHAAGRKIGVQTLLASADAGVSAMDPDLMVTERFPEQRRNHRVIDQATPLIDMGCRVVDLDVKRRTWSRWRERRSQRLDIVPVENGGDHDIADIQKPFAHVVNPCSDGRTLPIGHAGVLLRRRHGPIPD